MDNWKKYITDPLAESDTNSLASTVDLVFEAMASGGQDAIDFSNIDESNLNVEHAAVALRATFSRKDTMNGWYSLLGKVKRKIISKGLSMDILSGMV